MGQTKYYNKKDFKKLQNEWYKKLKEGGFNDIEFGLNNTPFIEQHEFDRISIIENAKNDRREEYYSLASKYYWENMFKSELDKLIWYYHSEGVPAQKIVLNLKKDGYSISKPTVYRHINSIKEMFLKWVNIYDKTTDNN